MSVMGLVNYFGDHLPHLADELRILREMEKECRVTKKLRWTDQRRQQFQRVKQIVNEMQELFFLNDTDPVRIYTDASDYAIGGYVCQVVEDKERPVGFMSKTLTTQQRKWTTTERECYAIYMTLRKFEYLVRDIPFEMYTDHENLVYLNNPPSNKVLRWKLAIQEYDFTLDHIKGELNVVADGLSRLTEDTPTTAECWEDTGDTRPDVSQPILHEVTNQIQVGSEPRASQGHVRHGTNPNPSMAREEVRGGR
jgi:hypothetical protein